MMKFDDENLAGDVLGHIFKFCTTNSLLALRATNSMLNKRVLDLPWSIRFFNKVSDLELKAHKQKFGAVDLKDLSSLMSSKNSLLHEFKESAPLEKDFVELVSAKAIEIPRKSKSYLEQSLSMLPGENVSFYSSLIQYHRRNHTTEGVQSFTHENMASRKDKAYLKQLHKICDNRAFFINSFSFLDEELGSLLSIKDIVLNVYLTGLNNRNPKTKLQVILTDDNSMHCIYERSTRVIDKKLLDSNTDEALIDAYEKSAVHNFHEKYLIEINPLSWKILAVKFKATKELDSICQGKISSSQKQFENNVHEAIRVTYGLKNDQACCCS